MNSSFEDRNIPRCPSVLILTDPQMDVKGRFESGKHLGWRQEKSRHQDLLVKELERRQKQDMMVAEGDKPEKGKKEPIQIRQRTIIAVPLSSDRTLAQLREQSVSPVTTLEEIKGITITSRWTFIKINICEKNHIRILHIHLLARTSRLSLYK